MAVASGGTVAVDYTYLWSDNQTTIIATGLIAGSYTVTATDDNGCTGSNVGGTVDVIENPLPSAVTTGGGTICAGDSLPDVTFTFTGTVPFDFTYTDDTTPTVVTNHGSTTYTITNASTGTYSVTALSDDNECIGTTPGETVHVS